MRLIDADELKKKFKDRSYWTYTHEFGDAIPVSWIMSGIDNAPTVELRLMKVEECAGHTLEYAMGWKACVEWIKKGGAE